jgi:intein/homing endonuclease
MNKRGRCPLNRVNIEWSPSFSYVLGLIASDGCLSADNTHVTFVSKDREQVENFKSILKLKNIIGKNYSGTNGLSYRIQFGDVGFCSFLKKVGITSAKSKTIGSLKIPQKYFYDFLRGSFDGDGTFYSYWDKRWKSSFMFYTEFISASNEHVLWIQHEIFSRLGVNGHITKSKNNSCYRLKYAKSDSVKILKKMYYKSDLICLKRKRLKISRVLAIVGEKL